MIDVASDGLRGQNFFCGSFSEKIILSPVFKDNFQLTPMNGISAFRSPFSCKKNKKLGCKALKRDSFRNNS